jgi:hypothetical protein
MPRDIARCSSNDLRVCRIAKIPEGTHEGDSGAANRVVVQADFGRDSFGTDLV